MKRTRGTSTPKTSRSLYTHTNVHTRDILRVWSYGMGGNSFGTIHFLLADTHISRHQPVISITADRLLLTTDRRPSRPVHRRHNPDQARQSTSIV